MKNYWKNRKVLVTGGAGFIGSYIVEELVRQGAFVTVAVSPKTSMKKIKKNLASVFTTISIKRMNLLSKRSTRIGSKGQDALLHFAALDGGKQFKTENERLVYEINTTMGFNILDAVRKNAIERLLIISSIEIYPPNTKNPIAEDQADIENENILDVGYAGAKRTIEREAIKLHKTSGMHIAIARLGNAYGPRDHTESEKRRVIPTFVQQALSNQPITLWGDGSQEVSFIHTSDIAKNVLRLVQYYAVADPVNIVSSQYISLKDLAEKIITQTKSKSSIVYANKMMPIAKNRIFSTKKAELQCGFIEEIILKKGLQETIISMK